MQFLNIPNPSQGIEQFSNDIISMLQEEQQVVWLMAGGSNIPIAAEILKHVVSAMGGEPLENLTISLMDERYGPVGHKDSNWQQLKDVGFDFSKVSSIEVLEGESLEETVDSFSRRIKEVMLRSTTVIGQFGIGADGHIAGILPHSEAVHATGTVFAYESAPYTRITLTVEVLKSIQGAALFAFGESKKTALTRLRDQDLSLDEEPAQLLKSIPTVLVYQDTIM
jgi:6-phosphogluconolactonase/glucosamine-6-phosphate isomerase/deaminase